MSKDGSISASVIKRLPRYYRFLGELQKEGLERISSRELSERMKLTASQIRQDLNCFGGFGQQGYGYHVDELRMEIGKILGVDKHFKTILIGAGNLGKAIATHINFETRGCNLIGIFDINPKLTGEVVGNIPIRHTNDIESFCEANSPVVAVLCIPKANTQAIADQLVNLGLKAFWNFSHYDIRTDSSKNIVVENSPNYGNQSVAEFALALLMDVLRKVTFSYQEYKNARIIPNCFIGMELSGKTMGIVGLGAIGSAFAKISYGLGMKILGVDKFEKKELTQMYGVKFTDFETLLKKSDFISIHAPLNIDNYHIFDEKSFDMMKNTAIIINTGRGELIDSVALFNALVNKKILGAGLDVLENEQTMTDFNYSLGINRLDKLTLEQTVINSKLFQLNNVIITPHIAYNTQEAINRILTTTMQNINAFCIGRLQNEIK